MLRLVYACLALTLAAFVLLIYASARQEGGYHGTTSQMRMALGGGALILDADSAGAVTQTGNGGVAGYNRSGDRRWSTRFDRFGNVATARYLQPAKNAWARCAGPCPSAIVQLGLDWQAFGGSDPELARAIELLHPNTEDVLAAPARDRAWVRAQVEGGRQLQLLAMRGALAQNLGVTGAQVVSLSAGGNAALVATASGGVGALRRFVRSGGRWQPAAVAVVERSMQNACFSPDGQWIGAISDRIRIFSRSGREVASAGQAVARGVCTIDSRGITVATNPASSPDTVRVTRYTLRAVPRWSRYLGRQQLLSAGGARLIVAFSTDHTLTAIDAVSGRTVTRRQLAERPFVGDDGAVVTAQRDGTPIWVAVPPPLR